MKIHFKMRKDMKIYLATGLALYILAITFEQQLNRMLLNLSQTVLYCILVSMLLLVVVLPTLNRRLLLKGKIILVLALAAWMALDITLIKLYFYLLDISQLSPQIAVWHIPIFVFGVLNVCILLGYYVPFVVRKIPARFKHDCIGFTPSVPIRYIYHNR
jgi:hypothetical protein